MPYCQSYFNRHFFLHFQPHWLFCRQTPAVVKMQDTLVSEQQFVLCPLQMCLWLGFSRLFWDRSDGHSAGERGLLEASQLVCLLPGGLLSIIAPGSPGMGGGEEHAHTWVFFLDLRRSLNRYPSRYCKHLVDFQSPEKVDLTSCALSCFLLWKSGFTEVLTLPLQKSCLYFGLLS